MIPQSKCEHDKFTLTLTPKLPHYGRYDCDDCKKFLGWAKKPENVERDKETARQCKALLDGKLVQREREFIASLYRQLPKLSPAQRTWLVAIWERNGRP